MSSCVSRSSRMIENCPSVTYSFLPQQVSESSSPMASRIFCGMARGSCSDSTELPLSTNFMCRAIGSTDSTTPIGRPFSHGSQQQSSEANTFALA